MKDSHVHIGQFHDIYYDPFEIATIVRDAGVEGMAFSSTTTCRDNVAYTEVEAEITALLVRAPVPSEWLEPYLWYIPAYLNQGVTVETAMASLPYRGIKLHPLAHRWDFANSQHTEALHGLFDYAGQHGLPVLIHTGHSGVDAANTFSAFFSEYPGTKIILAHCRPLEQTIRLLKKYENVYCDTAFVPEADIKNVVADGFLEKIIFGSDFPITHYYRTKYPQNDESPVISLKEQYAEDIKGGLL